MGKRRSPPVLWWRQLLGTGCWWLLSLSRTTLEGLRWLWRLAWYLLICYRSCWDFAFQFTEELGSALLLRLENSSEGSEEDDDEEDRASTAALEPEGTGQWWSCSGCVRPARPRWAGWRRWRPMSASSAPSWGLRNCCGAAGSWSCCGSSKAYASGCRSCHGTVGTAPRCPEMWRSQTPVGARERAQQPPGTRRPISKSPHRRLSHAEDAGTTEGLQKPSTASFTSSLDKSSGSVSVPHACYNPAGALLEGTQRPGRG